MSAPLFYQLFEHESSTYTYLLADAQTREAVLIDPVLETVDRDLQLIRELNLKLLYVLDTHVHADHITGAGKIRELTGAKTGLSADAGIACSDLNLKDGDEIRYGAHSLKVLSTPGHTNSCLSYFGDGRVFTGDALLIRGNGRTDFQQGSASKLFHSIMQKLYTLPSETQVFPGHDYRGNTRSSIAEEKNHNLRIKQNTTLEEFVKTMSELKLAHPKKIHEALPANLVCGSTRIFSPTNNNGIPEITCEELLPKLGKIRLIDVRRPDEWNGELSHIPGVEFSTLETDFASYLSQIPKDEEFVIVCRSGNRSGKAALQALQNGFSKPINLAGGMLRWNELGYNTQAKAQK